MLSVLLDEAFILEVAKDILETDARAALQPERLRDFAFAGAFGILADEAKQSFPVGYLLAVYGEISTAR